MPTTAAGSILSSQAPCAALDPIITARATLTMAAPQSPMAGTAPQQRPYGCLHVRPPYKRTTDARIIDTRTLRISMQQVKLAAILHLSQQRLLFFPFVVSSFLAIRTRRALKLCHERSSDFRRKQNCFQINGFVKSSTNTGNRSAKSILENLLIANKIEESTTLKDPSHTLTLTLRSCCVSQLRIV